MPCPSPETLLLLADHELSAAERMPVEMHLAGCEACRGFVRDVQALNAAGRTSIRAIPVSFARALVIPQRRRLSAPALLAAAAVLMLAISLAAVLFIAGRDERRDFVAAPEPVQPPTTTAARQITPLHDEAFERWAAEHRRKRVPLVPMEVVATYEPPRVPPYRGPSSADSN